MLQSEPTPNFKDIKKYYPHYYAGRGKSGATVYYEDCGGIDVPALTGLGITVSDLVRHYVYMTEFCFTVLNPSPEAKTITVFDVDGVGVGDVKGKVLEFIKETTAIMQAHYPERSQCILVVNAPIWFSAIWSIVRVFVNERTQSKVSISSTRSSLAALSKHLDYGEIPEKYGGGKRWRNGEGGKDNGRWWSEEEIRFREWVEEYGGVKHDEGDKERMERRVE
ncbi:hypothetical protein TrCOL_g331 [Triparma columacea]|uniref:CRAL-TRIO domain-containing protein n=1 Tax=Triparma columacea TaxID=722753 RepID=A0A9W7GED4_9STRA|nr:hypothetical protein TrCOL_g331 [Triparma columacea]